MLLAAQEPGTDEDPAVLQPVLTWDNTVSISNGLQSQKGLLSDLVGSLSASKQASLLKVATLWGEVDVNLVQAAQPSQFTLGQQGFYWCC